MLTMMCKAAPFKKLHWIINSGTIGVRHVSDSLRFGRFGHEDITSSTSVFATLKVTAVDNVVMGVENCLLSFHECLHLPTLRLLCTGHCVWKRLWGARGARRWYVVRSQVCWTLVFGSLCTFHLQSLWSAPT